MYKQLSKENLFILVICPAAPYTIFQSLQWKAKYKENVASEEKNTKTFRVAQNRKEYARIVAIGKV